MLVKLLPLFLLFVLRRIGSDAYRYRCRYRYLSAQSSLVFGNNVQDMQFLNGEKLTISCINCNSLNMSNSAKWNQSLKIYGITKLRSDIIFLSDVRLSNRNLVSAKDDVSRLFLHNPYEKYILYANSTKNKRGVGILIKQSLGVDVVQQWLDDNENILALRCRHQGKDLLLVSIYGPNNIDIDFFNNLTDILLENRDVNCVLGGDWNCTYSSSPPQENSDILNMHRLPNLTHSRKLKELCEQFDLVDPYRFLYPDSLEFTYVPRVAGSSNKSRLDFFCISDSLLDSISDCAISDSLQNKLFDHKACEMVFNNKPKWDRKFPAISNKDLEDDLLDFLVAATVCETYILHAEPAVLGEVNRNSLLERCGRIKWLIRDCGPPPDLIIGTEITEEFILARERKINRMTVIRQGLPLSDFEQLPLSCEPDIFFETLMLNVKNEVVSHQSFMRKCKISKISDLRKNISNLKVNYIVNGEQILRSESHLNKLVDAEMRSEMQKYRNFDIINMEKMTPRFLSLMKCKNTGSLLKIKKDDGSDFSNEEERYQYISDFYANIFRNDTPDRVLDDRVIENFLGDEICNQPAVKNSKLTVIEAEQFDNDISIQELDQAINKLNENSAGGRDGISTKFLKKFWFYFRGPLCKYANNCFAKKKLTQSFNSATIKLIPKKGETEKIKNWRPISLLNSVFKIISKAVDTRLEKICDIVLSRAQKGFTKRRHIQECIINISDTIAYCENTSTPAFVMALDMAKAFDTVKHDYMLKVYKFFGIGKKFSDILETITTGRTAAIIREDGGLSQPFGLGTGFPQGNNTSPKKFNVCGQVLIFKIEFDKDILPVKIDLDRLFLTAPAPAPVPVPVPAIPNREYGLIESNSETGKAEAFADDLTALGMSTPEAIVAITNILSWFADISGLKCNLDKSMIMVIGSNGVVPDYIANSNFKVTDKLTILGFEISRNFQDLTGNFTNVIEKIRKTSNFWAKYRLSLMGRINVAKCLMLSQISYVGSIISPTEEQFCSIETIINEFISSNLRLSKKYVNVSLKKGGIGMINVRHFIVGLQCSWIKRSFKNNIDLWRKRLNLLGYGNTLALPVRNLTQILLPVSSGILDSFEKFKSFFYRTNNNFEESYLHGNPCLIKSAQDKTLFNTEHLMNNNTAFLQIKQLCQAPGTLLPRDQLQVFMSTNVTLQVYTDLKISIKDSTALLSKSKVFTGTNQKNQSIESFITRFQKGSKPFRNTITNFEEFKLKCRSKTTSKTFFRLIDIAMPSESVLETINVTWALHFIPNKIREFIFKFNNNLLGLNTRVSHFNANISRSCTFCALGSVPIPVPDETFVHLFFECQYTSGIRNEFNGRLLPEINFVNVSNEKKFYFCGINLATEKQDNLFFEILTKVFMFSIWESKLNKKLPSFMKVLNDCYFLIDAMRRCSNKLRQDMNVDLTICRDWNEQASRRR
jgi:exonuclease III